MGRLFIAAVLRTTGTLTSASSAGATSPVIQFTCEAATSVVVA